MNYWHILARAQAALAEGRFREAETAFTAAAAARKAAPRRVFVTETLPDGARRLWQRLRSRQDAAPGGGRNAAADPGAGRWLRAAAKFSEEFRARSAPGSDSP